MIKAVAIIVVTGRKYNSRKWNQPDLTRSPLRLYRNIRGEQPECSPSPASTN
jgi:hypothetical protein